MTLEMTKIKCPDCKSAILMKDKEGKYYCHQCDEFKLKLHVK